MHTPHSTSTAALSPNRRRWWFRLLALTLSAGLAWATGEVALRVLGLSFGLGVFVNHPVFHHWQEANYRQLVYSPQGEYGAFQANFNRDGFGMRAELPARDTPSVVFLGDSFTLGREVPEEQRFVTLVGQSIGLVPLNFGCASFAPVLSRLEFEHFSPRVSPRAVMLLLYANDIDDEQRMRRLAVFDAQGRVTAVPGDTVPWWTWITRRSHVIQAVRSQLAKKKMEQQFQKRNAGGWGGTSWSPFFTRPISESFTETERADFEESIRQIAELCRQREVPFLLAAVPDRGALSAGSQDHFSNYVSDVAQRQQIRYVNLHEAFASRDPSELFFAQDIHFNAEGHALVAQVFVEALREAMDATSASTAAAR